MTTIAYHHKDKQIAVDSRITADGVICSDEFSKVIINELGTWVLCGRNDDYEILPTLKIGDNAGRELNCSAMLVKNGGVVLATTEPDGRYSESPVTFNDAQGSGYRFALAALDMGKSAKEAVEYAMTRDIYTGGKVQVINVETGEVI